MKLITKELEEAFAKQGDTSEKEAKDIKVICKFFNPMGAGTWWVYEKIDDDVYMCFALLSEAIFSEIGSISISELESLELPLGLGIERDLSYKIGRETLQEVIDKVQG